MGDTDLRTVHIYVYCVYKYSTALCMIHKKVWYEGYINR